MNPVELVLVTPPNCDITNARWDSVCRVSRARDEAEGAWCAVALMVVEEVEEEVTVVTIAGGGMYTDAESAESDTIIMVNKRVLRIDQTDLESAFVSGAVNFGDD